MPYCFSWSSLKFQGHPGWKIDDLNPIWVRLLGRSQLSNPSDLPCFVFPCLINKNKPLQMSRGAVGNIYISFATKGSLFSITIPKVSFISMTSLNMLRPSPFIVYNFIKKISSACYDTVAFCLGQNFAPVPVWIVFGHRPYLGCIWFSCVCLTIDMCPTDNGRLAYVQRM